MLRGRENVLDMEIINSNYNQMGICIDFGNLNKPNQIN